MSSCSDETVGVCITSVGRFLWFTVTGRSMGAAVDMSTSENWRGQRVKVELGQRQKDSESCAPEGTLTASDSGVWCQKASGW